MTNLIEIRGLRKNYPTFALDSINLAVPEGSIVGLVGSNGAGKTTIIRCLLGLCALEEGTIELLGQPVDESEAFAQVKERIGVVFDTCPFPIDYRVRDVGTLGKASYRNWDSSLFAELCASFNLNSKTNVKDLSRGMGMKLQLAFALAHRPDLLVLDEPTAGLDPIARIEALDLIRTFMDSEGKGALISTHITSDLEKTADHILCIDDGSLIFSQSLETICDMCGIAKLRHAEAELLSASDLFDPSSLRFMQNPYGIDVLIPDRFAFTQAFPNMLIERCSLESYMVMMLKGQPENDLAPNDRNTRKED